MGRMTIGAAVLAAQAGVAPGLAQDFVLAPPAPEVIAADAGNVVDATEIVVLAPDAAAADRLTAGAEALGYGLLARAALPALDLVLTTHRIPAGTGIAAAIAELEAVEPGTTAGANHAYQAEPLPRAAQGRSYAGGLIGWPEGGCPARVPVGILDTALAGDVDGGFAGARVVREEFVEEAGGDADHGTAIAGILAGPGRLRDASIYHATVVGRAVNGPPAAGVDAILQAIDWLQANEVRLVNVSLAGPYNKLIDRGVQAAARRGMVVIAAAGNSGPDGPPRYPAALRETIAVTAVDANLRPYASAPVGAHIDVAAPGVDVFVQGAETARYMTGTSIAAPFVTAIVAASPEAAELEDAEAVRAWLAEITLDLGDPGPDALFGAGLVQTPAPCGDRG